MTDYSKITALYSRLSVGDEDRDGGESNSIQNQKIFLENYARGQHLTNIRHYIDDDESGRFFDRSAYSRMMDDVENGKIGVCIMKDLTRWGRDYLQVGNAMEIFRRNNVRFIAVNNGIDSEKPDTLEFAPFINIMSEWYAKDISKKVKTGIKTKGMSGKPIVTEAPYGYVKDPDNKDFWIIDEEAAAVVRLIFRLFIGGKNRNQIAVYLTQEQIPTPTFYMKDRGRGTCKNKTLNEDNRCKWNKATLTNILTRQEYCGDVVNFKTTKHFRDKHNHYVDRSQWHITENVHEPIISRSDFETVQRILENAPVKRPNGDGEIHPLSGLLFCKDCGSKMHIRIDYRNGGKRHVAYQTYFLNMVDEADLLAAMQAAGGELPECSCADKCAVGAINTDCIVCAVNMGECQGKAPEPVPVVEPEPDPEPEQPKNSGGTILLVLAVAVIGGVAGWYFKIYRPKKQQAADAAEDYGDDYDDTSPWEDEGETESEDEA